MVGWNFVEERDLIKSSGDLTKNLNELMKTSNSGNPQEKTNTL
jgi:hypothetical protein